MRRFELGTTGIQVSAFCLGAMDVGSRTDPGSSYALLDQYLAAGGRFIDTANSYARWVEGCRGGESETLPGEWMRQRGHCDVLMPASKVGFPAPVDDLEEGPRALSGDLPRGASRLTQRVFAGPPLKAAPAALSGLRLGP